MQRNVTEYFILYLKLQFTYILIPNIRIQTFQRRYTFFNDNLRYYLTFGCSNNPKSRPMLMTGWVQGHGLSKGLKTFHGHTLGHDLFNDLGLGEVIHSKVVPKG